MNKTAFVCPLIAAIVAALLPAPACGQATQGQSESILFDQPALSGIAHNFHVPIAEHKYPAAQTFNLLLWQPNPQRPDGQLVATTWPVGDMTGFYPSAPLAGHQAAFRDAPGASAVQIDGGTVGAYIDSRDLKPGPRTTKMMITPAFRLVDAESPCRACRRILGPGSGPEVTHSLCKELSESFRFCANACFDLDLVREETPAYLQ
jgi:hypothetical protein